MYNQINYRFLHVSIEILSDYLPKFFLGRRDSTVGNQSVVSRFEMKQVASFADHESPVSSVVKFIILTHSYIDVDKMREICSFHNWFEDIMSNLLL